MKSIIQENRECYICRTIYNIEGSGDDLHHCLHGSYRQLADEDGLTVYLCRYHHSRLHDKGEFDMMLKIKAMRAYIAKLMTEGVSEEDARERFRKRYDKFFE